MRDAMAWMRDAMTWEEVRRRVLRMMRDARREEVSAFHELSALEHAADAAALSHALAALDAVARVRTLAPLLYAERVRLIADEYAGVLSTGAVVTLHDVATRLADIGRALDGEADR